jgi:hypothetical protein
MKSLSQSDTPLAQMLLSWATYRLARAGAAIRPSHSAVQIAAEVAASGNPAGT